MRPIIAVTLFAALCALPACDGATGSLTAPSSTLRAPNSPVGLVTINGIVRDTGNDPLPGVSVRSRLEQATTDATGAFSITTSAGQGVNVDKEGYESQEAVARFSTSVPSVTIFMQRLYLLNEADRLTLMLMPLDNPHYVGEPYESDYCRPCVLVRLRAPREHNGTVTLRWNTSANVAMWKDSSKCNVDAPSRCTVRFAGAGGDILLYVGLPTDNGQVQTLAQPLALELTSS